MGLLTLHMDGPGLDEFTVDPASVQLLDADFCKDLSVVILDKVSANSADGVTIGMLDPSDGELLEALREQLGRPIAAVRLSQEEIDKAHALGFGSEVPLQDASTANADSEKSGNTDETAEQLPSAEEPARAASAAERPADDAGQAPGPTHKRAVAADGDHTGAFTMAIETHYGLGDFEIDPASVRLLNYNFCTRNHVVVLDRVDPLTLDGITVGMLDPTNAMMVEKLKNILNRPVAAIRLNAEEIARALDIGFGKTKADDAEEQSYQLQLSKVRRIAMDPNQSADAIVHEILGRAISVSASDIHIEAYSRRIDLRFRIDGILHQINHPLTHTTLSAVISRIKILGEMDISERRKPQDGRITAGFRSDAKSALRGIDFRVSIVPGPFGEDAVLRLLDSSKPLVGLDNLGFSFEMLRRFKQLINNPDGMLLVTGPTGSGKTTTLYSALGEVISDTKKVLTAENPIEYYFDKANQKQVTPKMGFAELARAFMRQDPDVIMIGEIRDEETADNAVRAAQTGHLVLSTLHTNDSIATVTRLRTLGIANDMVAQSLLGALAQRLMRTICTACKEEVGPDAEARQLFKRLGAEFTLYRGQGCERCRQTGFKGRIGVYELFVVADEIAQLIMEGAPSHELRRHARLGGMQTLFEDALDKVNRGISTVDEMLRILPYAIVHEPLRSELH